MNDKLTIQELAAYLPYKLKVFGDGKIKVMNAYCGHSINWIGLEFAMKHSDKIKPILLPLSHLTKEIEHKGERFVPYLFWDDKERISLLSSSATDVIYCEYLEYFIIQKLHEWHFDTFGLIERGLAIDKTTIQ